MSAWFLILSVVAVGVNADDAPARTLTVAGKVTDIHGKVVAGASVYLREWVFARRSAEPERATFNDILATTTTDATGAFSFPNVALPTPYLDEISRANPQPWDVIVVAKGHSIAWSRLPPKGHERDMTLTLPPEAKLSGDVTDVDGKPVAGAHIHAVRFQGLEQSLQSPVTDTENLRLDGSHIVNSTESDAAGKFVLGGLPPDMRIVLFASHKDFARRLVYAATTEVPQPPVSVGRARPQSGAPTPRDEPVQTGNIRVQLNPGHRLRIRALLEDTGKSAVGAHLRQGTGVNRFEANSVSNTEGDFHIEQLGAGRITFEIAAPHGSEYMGIRVPYVFPLDHSESYVKLARGYVVNGTVVEEETKKGIGGVEIAYHSGNDRTRMFVVSTTMTSSDGTFRIVVPQGPGWLEIANHVPGYVMPDESPTTRTEPDERFLRPIKVVASEPTPAVHFTLTRGLIAHVRIVDPSGQPAAGAEVSGKKADADGKLTITGLLPYRNHELIATWPERQLAGRFTVSPRGEKQPVSVDVTLHATGRVVGRILGDDRKPIRRPSVQLLQHVPDTDTKIVFYAAGSSVPLAVAPDGTFAMDGVVPGISYNVNVSAPGNASAFGKPFEGVSGETHRLPDIVLPRTDQTIAGTAVDGLGRPLAGVQVYGTPVRAGGIERSVRIGGGQVYSDKNGRFRLTGIPRGPVRLSAYVTPPGNDGERLVRTHASLLVEAGRQDVRLVLTGPDVRSPVEAVVGKPAPEFPVRQWTNLEGVNKESVFRPSSFRDRVVLLAFMDEATPSTRLLNQLNELHKKWTDKGVFILRVYEQDGSGDGLTHPPATAAASVAPGLVPGGYSEAFQKYGVRATPTVFILDRTGTIRFVDPDPTALDSHIHDLTKR